MEIEHNRKKSLNLPQKRD